MRVIGCVLQQAMVNDFERRTVINQEHIIFRQPLIYSPKPYSGFSSTLKNHSYSKVSPLKSPVLSWNRD